MTADRSPELAAGVLAGIHAAELRRALTDLARRMGNRADEGDNPSDCLAMGDYADEIRDLVAKATPAEPAAGDDPTRTLARAAARSVVEHVPDEGWFPHDSKTPVPDACADAVLAALTTARLLTGPATDLDKLAAALGLDEHRAHDDPEQTTAHDDLRRHLLTRHHNLAALDMSDADALDDHAHEHRGPGTIRNHDPADLSYDQQVDARDDHAGTASVRCDPLAGYPGAYRVRTPDGEPYGDQEPIITQVAEGWAVMWGRTAYGLFQHHSILPGWADRDRAARAAVDLVAAVAAGEARSAPDLIVAMDAAEDFTTAGPPHPAAAARAQAAAEQLPTVGRWPG